MKTAIPLSSAAVMRWLIAIASVGACAAVISSVGAGAGSSQAVLLWGLVAMTFAAYAWGLFPIAGGTTVSGAVFLCLLWAWAAQRSVELGTAVAAFGVLWMSAVIQHRRRFKQFLRMDQLLDDLGEERTIKDQAVKLAQQTRENLRTKHARYQQLQSVAEQLSDRLELEAIAQLAVERAFELIGKSEVCLLFLVDKEQQTLSLLASRKAPSVVSVQTKHGDQFDRHVLRTHRPLLVNDVRRDFRFTTANTQSRPISSVIACPLLQHQSAEGVLRLDSSHPGAYTQDDLRFLDILLDLVATAVANARLFAKTQHLAMTDGLTELQLRRPFLEQLTRELARAERNREPLSVLMLDLDGFKAYNDRFGHTAGDMVLCGVAEVLREVVPPEGVGARYGGEEFSVLLPRASRAHAGKVAEAIRSTVERNLAKVTRMEHGAVTVSVGLATFPQDAQAEVELIRVADRWLYEAKRTGKNRVCSAEGHSVSR